MTYQQALEYLYSSLPMYQRIGGKAFNKDLKRTIDLCRAISDPQNDFKSLHIAGTNGKGSSAHAITAILQTAGYKTGLYTSPHLKAFTERVRINREEISEEEVVDFVVQNQSLLESIEPSFFEMTVALAFDTFKKHQIDLAIVEVGMGGRLDSTNIITPEVCLITSIGLDHQQFLGETVEEIALEKAGIIKPGIPVVIGHQPHPTLPVFNKVAAERGAALIDATSLSTRTTNDGNVDVYEENNLWIGDLSLSLHGQYFIKNLPGILKTIHTLRTRGFHISDDHIREGLAHVQAITGLKGRWQVLNDQPLTICDIGHNVDGIQAILHQISQTPFKQLHVVFGTVNDKRLNDILSLLPKDAHYYFCQPEIPRALNASELATAAQEFDLQGTIIEEVNQAIVEATSRADQDDMIFIGGSTFVVAEINNL